MIRRKYARKEENQQPNHDEKIISTIYGYCKETFEKKDEVKPNFGKAQCETYF